VFTEHPEYPPLLQMRNLSFQWSFGITCNIHSNLCTGPALAGAGPNARLRRGALLSSVFMTSSWSVNRATTFLF